VSKVEEQVVWKGADELRQYLRPITEVPDHDRNIKRDNEDQVISELKLSLARFGQVRAVLADEGPNKPAVTIAGHHVKKAAASLGWTHVAVIAHDFELSSDALAYLIADNALATIGNLSPEDQISLIEELAAQDALGGTGRTIDHAEDMRAQMSLIAESDQEFTGGYAATEEELAERARRAEEAVGQARKEVVLLLLPEVYEGFQRNVQLLRKRYGAGGAVETIVLAIEKEAARDAT